MNDIPVSEEQAWMRALASAGPDLLESGWEKLAVKPDYRLLRPVETGMTLLRGRIGGSGRPFNFGEATLTRAAVELAAGERGYAYLLGRRPREAELAAVFHALLKTPERRAEVEALIVRPALAAREAKEAAERAAVLPTKIDFSTMVRGDG
ncbi:MAG TPA: phosphonate C-P lyase system protein PhnG [Rhizobiaceae bacterium]|nr:phosphonate C-P lyase system protein PhnG [Rhizobiaceae bacterium]